MSKYMRKIIKANITHISLVPKGANGVDFLIVKGKDAPNVTTDIPILKMNNEKRIVTGVVYEPDVSDSQGDFMDADTIEKTAYEFMENHQNIDIKHDFKANDKIKVVESYIAKNEETIGNKKVQPGTWVMSVKVNDDTIWEGIKKGDFNGFSMGGTGVREEVRKGDNMTEEQVRAVVQSEMKEVMEAIKRMAGDAEENHNEDKVKEIIKSEMKPLAELVEQIAKSRGLSMQLKPQKQDIQKSNTGNVWEGLNL